MKDQFDKRGVHVFGLSIDTVESHLKFISDINDLQDSEDVNVTFHMIADEDGTIAKTVSTL